MSVDPPGANGTISRIGLSGYAAAAWGGSAAQVNAAAMAPIHFGRCLCSMRVSLG